MSQASKDKSLGVSLLRSGAGPDMFGLSEFGVPDVSDRDALLVAGWSTDNEQLVSDGRGSALWMRRTDTSYYLAVVAEENFSEVSWAFVRWQGSMTLTTG